MRLTDLHARLLALDQDVFTIADGVAHLRLRLAHASKSLSRLAGTGTSFDCSAGCRRLLGESIPSDLAMANGSLATLWLSPNGSLSARHHLPNSGGDLPCFSFWNSTANHAACSLFDSSYSTELFLWLHCEAYRAGQDSIAGKGPRGLSLFQPSEVLSLSGLALSGISKILQ